MAPPIRRSEPATVPTGRTSSRVSSCADRACTTIPIRTTRRSSCSSRTSRTRSTSPRIETRRSSASSSTTRCIRRTTWRSRSERCRPITTGHEDFSTFNATGAVGPQSNADLKGHDIGVYAQTTYAPMEWFELRTGLRYDTHNAPFVGTQSQLSPRVRLSLFPSQPRLRTRTTVASSCRRTSRTCGRSRVPRRAAR